MFDFKTAETIIANIVAILGIVGTAIGIIISILQTIGKHKEGKARDKLDNTIDMLNTINGIVAQVEETMENAQGSLKKEVATAKALTYAIQKHYDIDEQALDKMIESCVTISKRVNKRDKDKGGNL